MKGGARNSQGTAVLYLAASKAKGDRPEGRCSWGFSSKRGLDGYPNRERPRKSQLRLRFSILLLALFFAGIWSCKERDRNLSPLRAGERERLSRLHRFEDVFNKDKEIILETKPEATVLSLTDLRFGERGEIFVVDGMSSCVFVFSQNGKFLRRIGTKGQGPGELRNPGGIALSRDGRIYVSDTGNARISIFTADGKYVNSVKLSRPGTHLEVNGGGNFYLLGSGSWSVVHKFDPGGKFLASFGEPPEQLRRLGLPISGGSLDVDDAGNCYYVHVAQYAIQKYSPQGKLLKVFTRHAPFYQPLTRTPQPGETMKSWYDSWTPIFKIVVLKRGMVLIQIRTAKSGSELYENMIDIFDTEGNFLTGGLYNTYRLMGRDEDDHLIFAERQEPQSLEFIPNPRIIRFFLQVNDGVDS